jgi:ABC-type branched-subunit amino acid transport system permease subunit
MIGAFISQIVGAFVVWTLNGYRGSINDEIAGPEDDGFKKNRNHAITISILLVLFWIFL